MRHLNKSDIAQALQRRWAATSDFDLNPNFPKPDANLRDAAVLVCFIETEIGPQVMLTKRAAHLKHHPGQVSFPGGKVDATDPSIEHAALREGWEETALPKNDVAVLGVLPPHQTVTEFNVTPVVGWASHLWDVAIDPNEVAEAFLVPATHLLNPANYRVEHRIWQGQARYYYVIPYGPYYIWGATARILFGLAEHIS